MKKILFYLCILFGFTGCEESLPLDTVSYVDLERYQGTWYEIGRLPNNFERDAIKVTANYQIKENGRVRVLNRAYNTKKEKWIESLGEAKVIEPGKLKVSFFKPFYGDYYIMELDENYQWVLVGNPSRDYLWILSRTPEISEELYDKLLNIAKEKGFETNNFIKTEQ